MILIPTQLFTSTLFDTLPDIRSDITLLIAYVNVGFDSDTMCSNQVFGLSPAHSWIKQKLLALESSIKCALKLEEDFDYGTWRLDRQNEWKTYFDEETEWVCIGKPETRDRTINVHFIDNAIAVLNIQGELQALWLKPIISKTFRILIP